MSYRFERRMYNPFSRIPYKSLVMLLLIANVVVYLVSLSLELIARATGQIEIAIGFMQYFAMVPKLITTHYYVWQFATAMFLHGGFFHILFNMLYLLFFGPELEWLWGKTRFLTVYFAIGILANLFSYVLNIHSPTATLGASGAILGIVAAYAAIYPNREIIVIFFPLKLKYFIILLFLIPSFLGIAEGGGGVAHVVHIVGIVLGVAYVKLKWRALENLQYDIKERWRRWRIKRKYRNFRVVDSEVKKLWDDLEDNINKDETNRHIN